MPRTATKPNNGRTAPLKRRASCNDVVRRVLSKIREIDAVFLLSSDADVVHVFTVVREFRSSFYDALLKSERAIEKNFPLIAFDFHVRAHQGREPAQAVPFEAKLVYAR